MVRWARIGRDIGTVFVQKRRSNYVVASAEVRAERRHNELPERGEASIYARVLQDMKDRDERDTNRSVAPLKPVMRYPGYVWTECR